MPAIKIGPYGPFPNVHFQTDSQVSTLTYAASTTLQLALPRDGFVTEVDIDLDPLSYAGAATPGLYDDASWKALGGIKVDSDGGKSYLTFTDARGFHYGNVFDYGDSFHFGSLSTATSGTLTNYRRLRFHTGVHNYKLGSGKPVHDPYDLSAGINGPSFSQFQIEWTTPANTVIGSGDTIGTGTILKASVSRVMGLPDFIVKLLPVPAFFEELYTPAATSTDLGYTVNIPIGYNIVKTIVIVTNSTAAPNDSKSDAYMNNIGVIKQSTSRQISQTWRDMRLDTAAAAGWAKDMGSAEAAVVTNDIPNTGVVVIDWRRLTGRKWGLDTTQMNLGDVKVGFTIATANGGIKLWHQAYRQVPPWESVLGYGV